MFEIELTDMDYLRKQKYLDFIEKQLNIWSITPGTSEKFAGRNTVVKLRRFALIGKVNVDVSEDGYKFRDVDMLDKVDPKFTTTDIFIASMASDSIAIMLASLEDSHYTTCLDKMGMNTMVRFGVDTICAYTLDIEFVKKFETLLTEHKDKDGRMNDLYSKYFDYDTYVKKFGKPEQPNFGGNIQDLVTGVVGAVDRINKNAFRGDNR